MPLFSYSCAVCGLATRVLAKNQVEAIVKVGTHCGLAFVRDNKPITAQAVETLDNGLMPKSVTRVHNAEELNRERSKVKLR